MKFCVPLVLFATVAGISGCDASSDQRILAAHMVEHLNENGFKGRFRRTNAEKIGAESSGRFFGEGFDIELAKFEDADDARRLQRRGFNDFRYYAHGRYVMLIRTAEKEQQLVKVFREF